MSFRGQRFAVLSLVVGLSMAAPLGAMPAHAADADVRRRAMGADDPEGQGPLQRPGERRLQRADARRPCAPIRNRPACKQTGQLDAATSGHMLAARQSTAQSTMGNLAGPGGKPQPSQTNRNVEPPKPLASPTTRVETHGSETGVQALGVIGHSAGPSSAARRQAARSSASARQPRSAARSEPAPAPRPAASRGARPRRAGPAGCSPDPRRFRRSGGAGRDAGSSRPGGNRPDGAGLGAFGWSSPCWPALSASPALPSGAAAGGRPAPASPRRARIRRKPAASRASTAGGIRVRERPCCAPPVPHEILRKACPRQIAAAFYFTITYLSKQISFPALCSKHREA